MGLSLWNIFKVILLVVNSLMVLNRERFLSKYQLHDLAAVANDPLKSQLVGLLHAVHYLKVPVIAANALTILFEVIFGG